MESLKELREKAGKSMRLTAEDLGIPYTTYVSYEKGTREPNSEMLVKIAEYYHTTTDFLLGRLARNSMAAPTIGERIRDAREARKMSQEELGRACKTTKQTIYKYESGLVTNIPLDRLEAIADALGVSSAYLAGLENTEEYQALHRIAEDMYTTKVPDRMAEDLSAEELEIVSILRKMSPEQLARELAYLRQASADGQDKELSALV